MSFKTAFAPHLDKLRSQIPTAFGVRSVTLVVRTSQLSGSMIEANVTSTVTDVPIVSSSGDRYKVREVSTRDVVASGGKYQTGTLRVGPITPPFPGSGFTKDQLIPPSVAGQDVYYGVTDQTGVTQWCQMADANTAHDLRWYITLNPTGVVPGPSP